MPTSRMDTPFTLHVITSHKRPGSGNYGQPNTSLARTWLLFLCLNRLPISSIQPLHPPFHPSIPSIPPLLAVRCPALGHSPSFNPSTLHYMSPPCGMTPPSPFTSSFFTPFLPLHPLPPSRFGRDINRSRPGGYQKPSPGEITRARFLAGYTERL